MIFIRSDCTYAMKNLTTAVDASALIIWATKGPLLSKVDSFIIRSMQSTASHAHTSRRFELALSDFIMMKISDCIKASR